MSYPVKNTKGEDVKFQGKNVIGSIGSKTVVKSVDLDKRKLVMTGSTEDPDRDGDIIIVRGWEIENYLNNPVFLWAHNYSSVPIAAAEKVVKKRGPWRLVFTLQFPSEGVFPFADMILQLYHEKIINASSVGFSPIEFEELESDSNSWWPPRKYTKQELLELSGCAVPCNPNALQNSIKSFGGDVSDFKAVYENMEMPIIDDAAKEQLENELGEVKAKVAYEEETEKVQVDVPEKIETPKEIDSQEDFVETDEKEIESQEDFVEVKFDEGEVVRLFADIENINRDIKEIKDTMALIAKSIERKESGSEELNNGSDDVIDSILTPQKGDKTKKLNASKKSLSKEDEKRVKQLAKLVKQIREII